MTIKVTANDNPTQIKNVTIGDNVTLVKKVVVGRPIRRVSGSSVSIEFLGDVDTSTKTDGSVLVYNETTQLWESTVLLEKQTVNGGQY